MTFDISRDMDKATELRLVQLFGTADWTVIMTHSGEKTKVEEHFDAAKSARQAACLQHLINRRGGMTMGQSLEALKLTCDAETVERVAFICSEDDYEEKMDDSDWRAWDEDHCGWTGIFEN